jgi:outer membrane lipoprotein SlyB
MKKIFKADVLSVGAISLSGCINNTNAPYTRAQGALGGAVVGAIISEATGGDKDDGAIVGAVTGYLTGNPCQRIIRDNLGTPGIDVSQVACDGVAAQGYDINGPVAPQGYYTQPQRGSGIFGGPGFR